MTQKYNVYFNISYIFVIVIFITDCQEEVVLEASTVATINWTDRRQREAAIDERRR